MSDLFAWAAARSTDPDTSHEAAAASPGLRAADRRKVLLIHASYPMGLTDFELAALAARQQTSFGKRRGELRDAGYIVDSSLRRPAPSGASAIVWQITEAGRALARRLGAAS
jgi:hypothetical protein